MQFVTAADPLGTAVAITLDGTMKCARTGEVEMRLTYLAEKVGAQVLTNRDKAAHTEVERAYAGDRMSNLISEGSETTLLVTNLSNAMLPRVAELVDAAGLCLLNGLSPEPEVVSAAEERGIVLMVSPVGMFETCGHLYRCLESGRSATR